MPILFLVTPTYARCTQLADLNRFKNTLLHVPKIIWIIIEDSPIKTETISKFLQESKIPFVHLVKETIKNMKKPDKSIWTKHKGIYLMRSG